MVCCTNCTFVRTKSRNGTATHYDASGFDFDFQNPPDTPILPPSSPRNGDILIEYYDNALVFWRYNSNTNEWVLGFYHIMSDRYNTNYDAGVTTINFASLPNTPIAPPLTPYQGDTLHERYANGQVFWTYNGSIWVRNYVISSGNNNVHRNEAGTLLDEASLPAAPLNPIDIPTVNATIIEHYDNADLFWTYNGSMWVLDFYSSKCCTILNDEAGNTFDPNNIIAPLTDTAGTDGNTLIERYDNATVYWQYIGTQWVYQFYNLDGISNKHTHRDETLITVNIENLPSEPNNPPLFAIANDTLMEHYANGNLYWTYNGTAWVFNYSDFNCCTLFNNESTEEFSSDPLPTEPIAPPINVSEATFLIERYGNATVFWRYNGLTWIYQFHILDARGNRHIHSDETDLSIDYASLPTEPTTNPVDSLAGDTLVEHYSNGTIHWIFNGITWLFDWLDSDCCTILNDEGSEALDINNLPISPLNPPNSSSPGNVIIEKYNNAIVFWEFDGTEWLYKFHQLQGGGNKTTYANLAGTAIDYANLPTEPDILPVAIEDDTLIEHYDNGTIYWTYNGTSWVLNWIDSVSVTVLDNRGNATFNVLSLPTDPVSPPTNPSNGQILIEHYANGEIFWKYVTNDWQLVFYSTKSIDTYNTHYDASGSSLDTNSLPLTPVSPPTGINPNHTLHEKYDNGQAFWTYNGTLWELDYVIVNTNGTYEYVAAATYDCDNPPALPEFVPTISNPTDRIVEHYNNDTRFSAVTIIWEYDGIDWNLVNTIYHPKHFIVEELTEEIVPLNVANETGYLEPINPGLSTSFIEGDTLHEQYSNGYILWEYIGCVWLRKTISLSCECFEAYVTPIITVDSQDICVGQSVEFTDASIHHSDLETVCTYQSSSWDFGDGDTATGQVVTHTFSDIGLYFVELTSTCNSGASATQVIAIKVNEVEADIVTPTSGIVDAPVSILNGANVSGCSPTYLWDFGDGTTSTLQNPGSHTYDTPGNYTVTLTVTCTNGCTDTISYIVNIAEEDTVIVAFTVSDSNICVVNGDTATITNGSTANVCIIDTWLWEVSVNGGPFSTLSTSLTPPVYNPTVAGTHIIRLTATCSSTGLTGSTTRTIVVENPSMVINFSQSTVTTNSPVTISDGTTGCTVTSRQWTVSYNGGAASNISTQQLFTYTPTADGTYEFELTITCANGCTETLTRTLTSTATPFVSANFTIVDDTLSLNLGNSTALNDTSIASGCTIDTWLWEVSVNGGSYSTIGTTQNIAAYTPAASGTHTIRLTATCSSSSASDTESKIITVSAITASMSIDNTTIGAGDTVNLTDTSTSVNCTPYTRQWAVSYNGGAFTNIGTSSPQAYTAAASGTYTFKLTVTCADGVTVDDVTDDVSSTPDCAGTETCYVVCAPNATFANWTQSTTWNGANENFGDSVVRNQVIRDGSRISNLTNIAGTGINGTITGDGSIKTTNAGVNESSGSLSLRITEDGTNDRRAVIMTFSAAVDATFNISGLRNGQFIHVTSTDGNLHYYPYSDGSPAVPTVTGDNTDDLMLQTTLGDTDNKYGFICATEMTQFRFEFGSTRTSATVVNTPFTMNIKANGASNTYRVCDVSGVLTIVNVSNPSDTPSAIGLDWDLTTCP